jgi:membrane-bound metal-dependent hydrolase YbcI (DUF457 family)
MNYGEHSGIAIAIAIIIYFLYNNWIQASISMLFIGAIIPDIIEPPINYKHRKFFHSRYVLNLFAIGTGISFIITLFWFPFSWIFYFALGYLSHLLADSTSKMGLPER